MNRMTNPSPDVQAGEAPPAPALGAMLRAQRCSLQRSLHQVAREAGCSKSYLSQIENGRVAPPAESLLARLEVALGLAAGSLARPARRARAAARPRALSASAGISLRHDLARLESALARLTGWLDSAGPAEEAARIPVVNAAEAPGRLPPGESAAGGDFLAVPGLREPGAFAIRLRGDDMEPQYRAGDLVVFSPARPARSGADCFITLRAGRGGLFARVYFAGDGPVRLHPLNSEHQPRLVPRRKIAGLHPAIAVIRSIA